MAKNAINTRLVKAAALHQAGNLAEAERLYDQVLALDRANPDALNLKGVIANDQGRHADALAFFDRAIPGAPKFADLRYNRGLALAGLGRNDDALQAYLQALTLKPAYADARLNLGLLLHAMERKDDAIGAFRAMTQVAPNDARGFYNLGACLEKSLPKAPEAARPAIAEEARAAFTRALALDPDNPDAHFAFANLHSFLGEYPLAIPRLKVALSFKPTWHDAWNNLGSQYEALGRRDEALAALDRAVALAPDDPAPIVNRGMTYLVMGRLAEGWEGYARRFEDRRFPFVRRNWPWPAWRGEDLGGKSILVWSDQGIGDEVLYASMIPDVAARAGSCVVECAPRLVPLYRRAFPALDIVPHTPEGRAQLLARGFDFQISVLDLGRWLRPRLPAFPNRGPLLTADPARAEEIRRTYQAKATGRRLVGLSWRSVTPDMSHQKGQPLGAFLPLLQSEKLYFVNLQYGDVTAELDALQRHHNIEILNDSQIDSLNDLDAFAAQVAALDAVVTISNTTAHVAGALGVPTCLVVPQGLKQLWYWFDGGAYSPWYRSIRVYRQPPAGSVTAIKSSLEAW